MTRDDIKKGMRLHFNNGAIMYVSAWAGGWMTDTLVATNSIGHLTTVLTNVVDENLNCLIPNVSLEKIVNYDNTNGCSTTIWRKPIEISIDDIALKFNVSPEQVRIKK